MTDYQDTVEWTAKGDFAVPNADQTAEVAWTAKSSFGIPAMFLSATISWDAKGSVEVALQQTLSETIEWIAASNFTPPHSFIFIDLR